jgi:hypothetical protein
MDGRGRGSTMGILVSALVAGCTGGPGDAESVAEVIGGGADPNPAIAFMQVTQAAGINRSNEPASAGAFDGRQTYAYNAVLADLDGDGRLDYYAVNHGQTPHVGGLFVNTGAGTFGRNLYTVSVQPSQVNWPNLNLSNEIKFAGDLTGDGRVDLFFQSWSGFGVMCANQGIVSGSDWTGPGYVCYGTSDGLAFSDVNGDGRIDVLALEVRGEGFDVYTAYHAQTASYVWRLNNGNPNIGTWPINRNFLALRVTDPAAVAAPFVDLNGDTIPDKIVGIPRPANNRGTYGTLVSGHNVFLGQADGTYVQVSGSGLGAVTEPITRVEDVNEDGCIDVGVDVTSYRDNQAWYTQNKVAGACSATFTLTARTALPYLPGFRHVSLDVDNSGLISKAVINHIGYGHGEGRPVGASIYRKLPNGSYAAIPPSQNGINLVGTEATEFYSDSLFPGDWNDDGRVDLAGSGSVTIPGSDSGYALWSSNLSTTNSWIKVTLPTVTGFFVGKATIEVFDAGAVGDPTRLVTPPQVLYPGKTWASQVLHFGIGTRTSVDVRVTFPDGRVATRTQVAPQSRIAIQPAVGIAPTARASANPLSAAVGQPIAFDGTGSSDPDGTIVSYAWDFGDGTQATTAIASHAYASAGTFLARLTVTDNSGSVGTASVTISIADATAPSVSITGAVFTPTVSDNVGVVRVEWYFDGALSATATTSPFSYTLNLTPVAGSHTLVARAFDAAGNSTDSSSLILQR